MSVKLKTPLSLSEVCDVLNLSSETDSNLNIEEISDSNIGGVNSICDYVKGCLPKSGTVLITPSPIEGFTCLLNDNPTLKLIELINYIKKEIGFEVNTIKPKLGKGVLVGKNSVIEDDVIIGSNTIIEHNVVIHSGVVIGNNSIIRSGAIIGGEGYAFIQDGDRKIRQPSIGRVIIGHDVEVGYNCTVVKGIVGNTILEDSVKLDNLVHIAHDCNIGKSCTITAGVTFCGYVTVGEETRVAPNATIKQRLIIGKRALIGLGAVITKNVDDNEILAGNPAKIIRKIKK